MVTINPEHLFEQADRLTTSSLAGSPRQAERRAISSAYYGLFHLTLTSLADEFVGVTQRVTGRYALVYRSVDHRALKDLCIEAQKQIPAQRYGSYIPKSGFGPEIQAFAAAVNELQEKRHRADYDPRPRFKTADAKLAIRTARDAAQRFVRASDDRRKAFLTLLLCPPR